MHEAGTQRACSLDKEHFRRSGGLTEMLFYFLENFSGNHRIPGDYISLCEHPISTLKIANPSPSLFHKEHTGGHVVIVQVELEKTIKAPAGEIGRASCREGVWRRRGAV